MEYKINLPVTIDVSNKDSALCGDRCWYCHQISGKIICTLWHKRLIMVKDWTGRLKRCMKCLKATGDK